MNGTRAGAAESRRPRAAAVPQGTRLLVLGGNRYNVGAVQAARAAGFLTLVADRNPKAPGLAMADVGWAIDILDTEALLAAAARCGGVHGVVSMAEAGVRSAAHLAQRLGLASLTPVVAERATSKAAMRRCWAGLGRYSTDFRVVRALPEAIEAVGALGFFPLILKPDRSLGGARGVSRVERIDAVEQAFRFAQSGGLPGSDVVIERCLSGTEHSAEVLIWEGETSVLCVGQKVKSGFPYRVDVSVQYPAALSASQTSIVTDMCEQAVAALGLSFGAAHIEFVYTREGPVLLELGARCGGGHTPQIAAHVSGVSEFVQAARMACGLAPTQWRPSTPRGADYRFLVLPAGRVAAVNVADEVCAHPGILDVGFTIGPGDQIRPLRTTADRAGFLVALGEQRQEAMNLADWACRRISVAYADGTVAYPYLLEAFAQPSDGWPPGVQC